MIDFGKILDNIQKSNYEQFHVSTLATSLKHTDSIPAADFLPQFYVSAVKAFEKKFFVEAVFILAYCYNAGYKRDEIYKIIIDNYYLPFADTYKKTYNDNVNALKNYEFICEGNYTEFSDLDVLFLPMDLDLSKIHEGYIKYSKKEDKFETVASFVIDNKKTDEIKIDLEGQRVLLYNVYDTNFIIWMHQKTHYDMAFALRTPNHLYYDSRSDFLEFLQIIDFTKCLKIQKAVFIFGESELESFLLKPENIISNLIFCHSSFHPQANKIHGIINSINKKKEQLYIETVEKLNGHYSSLTPAAIREKIINKTARIALMVSRCTTAVQYYIRDCHEAFKKLSYASNIFTEKNDLCAISGSNKYELADFILNFKPDIILIIDHLRWEWDTIPRQLVFICWIMDHLPILFDPKSAEKTQNMDFILSLYLKHPSFQKVGYPQKQLINGPLPSNPYIYKKYELTQAERDNYSADICIISNSGNAMETMENFIFSSYNGRTDVEFVKIIKSIYLKIYDTIYDAIYYEKKHYYHDETRKLFFELFIDRAKIISLSNEIERLMFEFWGSIVTCMYKDIAILWLHEKGYDIKLWGRAWPTHPVLKKYAMGVAPNGEGMSKILNASKISIGLTPNVTLHPRVTETLLSGCLYIGNDIRQGEDWCNARDFFKPGAEIILFKNKTDLYKKVDYYLSNTREREAVAAAGRKKALETLTYEIVMKNTLDRIVERLSELS